MPANIDIAASSYLVPQIPATPHRNSSQISAQIITFPAPPILQLTKPKKQTNQQRDKGKEKFIQSYNTYKETDREHKEETGSKLPLESSASGTVASARSSNIDKRDNEPDSSKRDSSKAEDDLEAHRGSASLPFGGTLSLRLGAAESVEDENEEDIKVEGQETENENDTADTNKPQPMMKMRLSLVGVASVEEEGEIQIETNSGEEGSELENKMLLKVKNVNLDVAALKRGSYEVTNEGTLKTNLFAIGPTGFRRTEAAITPKSASAAEAAHNDSNPASARTAGKIADRPHLEISESCVLEMGLLGRGAGGKVLKSLHKPSLTLIALKCIDVSDKVKRAQLLKELKELDTDYCPHIVAFYGAYYKDTMFTVKLGLEYMNRGSLQAIIHEHGALSELALTSIVKQTLLGLKHLHDNRKLHRDIKPGNILVNHFGITKLSDFGIIAELSSSLAKCGTFVGTTIYMSPERLTSEAYSYPADVWSLGLSIITMATGSFPMSTDDGYWGLVMHFNTKPPPSLPETFSPSFRDFVSKCLVKEPAKRWRVGELLQHPWILNGCESEESLTYWPEGARMFEPDPEVVQKQREERLERVRKCEELEERRRKREEVAKIKRQQLAANKGIAEPSQQQRSSQQDGSSSLSPSATVLNTILTTSHDNTAAEAAAARLKHRRKQAITRFHPVGLLHLQAEAAQITPATPSQKDNKTRNKNTARTAKTAHNKSQLKKNSSQLYDGDSSEEEEIETSNDTSASTTSSAISSSVSGSTKTEFVSSSPESATSPLSAIAANPQEMDLNSIAAVLAKEMQSNGHESDTTNPSLTSVSSPTLTAVLANNNANSADITNNNNSTQNLSFALKPAPKSFTRSHSNSVDGDMGSSYTGDSNTAQHRQHRRQLSTSQSAAAPRMRSSSVITSSAPSMNVPEPSPLEMNNLVSPSRAARHAVKLINGQLVSFPSVKSPVAANLHTTTTPSQFSFPPISNQNSNSACSSSSAQTSPVLPCAVHSQPDVAILNFPLSPTSSMRLMKEIAEEKETDSAVDSPTMAARSFLATSSSADNNNNTTATTATPAILPALPISPLLVPSLQASPLSFPPTPASPTTASLARSANNSAVIDTRRGLRTRRASQTGNPPAASGRSHMRLPSISTAPTARPVLTPLSPTSAELINQAPVIPAIMNHEDNLNANNDLASEQANRPSLSLNTSTSHSARKGLRGYSSSISAIVALTDLPPVTPVHFRSMSVAHIQSPLSPQPLSPRSTRDMSRISNGEIQDLNMILKAMLTIYQENSIKNQANNNNNNDNASIVNTTNTETQNRDNSASSAADTSNHSPNRHNIHTPPSSNSHPNLSLTAGLNPLLWLPEPEAVSEDLERLADQLGIRYNLVAYTFRKLLSSISY